MQIGSVGARLQVDPGLCDRGAEFAQQWRGMREDVSGDLRRQSDIDSQAIAIRCRGRNFSGEGPAA